MRYQSVPCSPLKHQEYTRANDSWRYSPYSPYTLKFYSKKFSLNKSRDRRLLGYPRPLTERCFGARCLFWLLGPTRSKQSAVATCASCQFCQVPSVSTLEPLCGFCSHHNSSYFFRVGCCKSHATFRTKKCCRCPILLPIADISVNNGAAEDVAFEQCSATQTQTPRTGKQPPSHQFGRPFVSISQILLPYSRVALAWINTSLSRPVTNRHCSLGERSISKQDCNATLQTHEVLDARTTVLARIAASRTCHSRLVDWTGRASTLL